MSTSLVLFLLSLLMLQALTQARRRNLLSYTSSGNWTEAHMDVGFCERTHLCTPATHKVWKPEQEFVYYDSAKACQRLIERGIKKIYFHGDSYMRQIYSGMLITLSGNYKNGSLIESDAAQHCQYEKQFNEKTCGTRLLNHYGLVCNGAVLLDPLLIGVDNLNHCSKDEKNIILWSFGNHKLSRHGRYGVNNATAFSELFMRNPCPLIKENTNDKCQIYWVSTHYRLRAYFPDEEKDVVKTYNEGMRQFYDSGACGKVNYIDVYNMTRSLGEHFTSEAELMTYDMVHWGFEVNLNKAQIILNALLS